MKYTLKEVKQAMQEWADDAWEDEENNTKDESDFLDITDWETKEGYVNSCVNSLLIYLNK